MKTLVNSAALAVAMGLGAAGAMAQDVTLEFQHFVSPASANPTYFMQPWVDAVEA